MTNKSGLWWGDGCVYHSKYHPYQCLSSDLSLRAVSLRWWVSMGWVNIQQQIVPYVDVWNTTNTSGENNYDHRRSSFFSTMPTYRTLSTNCECASMAFMGQNNNQQSTMMCMYVRETLLERGVGFEGNHRCIWCMRGSPLRRRDGEVYLSVANSSIPLSEYSDKRYCLTA